jgi:hypothetical protein
MSSLATARAPPGGCPNVMPPDSWLTYVPVFRSPMCPVCTLAAPSRSAESHRQVVFSRILLFSLRRQSDNLILDGHLQPSRRIGMLVLLEILSVAEESEAIEDERYAL